VTAPAAMSLRDIRPCDLCGRKLCHTQLPLFWRIRIERMAIDLKVAQQLEGLSMFLGSSQMAEAFAPSTDLVKPMDQPDELLVCEHCALPGREAECIGRLAEIAGEGKRKRDAAKVPA
jgi:hypothetical protein